eukprot:jgi/Botrbrau1/14532/Bobra.0235s0004.1
MEREAKLAIIKGLPEEAKETGMFSSSAGKDLEGLWEIISTTAKGLGFNDQVPRVTPVARAAITPAYSTTPGTASPRETQAGGQGGQASSTKVEGRDRRDNRRCRYCNKLGHFERNCLKKEADEKMQQNLQQVMAAMANLLPQFQNQASAAVARPLEGGGNGNNFFPGGYPPPSGGN